jgi:hypothetical protein
LSILTSTIGRAPLHFVPRTDKETEVASDGNDTWPVAVVAFCVKYTACPPLALLSSTIDAPAGNTICSASKFAIGAVAA